MGFGRPGVDAVLPVLICAYMVGMDRGAMVVLLAAGSLYLACSWLLTPLVLLGGVFAVVLGLWAVPLYFAVTVAALGWSASRRVAVDARLRG